MIRKLIFTLMICLMPLSLVAQKINKKDNLLIIYIAPGDGPGYVLVDGKAKRANDTFRADAEIEYPKGVSYITVKNTSDKNKPTYKFSSQEKPWLKRISEIFLRRIPLGSKGNSKIESMQRYMSDTFYAVGDTLVINSLLPSTHDDRFFFVNPNDGERVYFMVDPDDSSVTALSRSQLERCDINTDEPVRLTIGYQPYGEQAYNITYDFTVVFIKE